VEGTPVPFDFFAPGDSCTIRVELTRPTVAQQLAVDLTIQALTLLGQSDTTGMPAGTTASTTAECDGTAGDDWTLTATFVDTTSANPNRMPAATADVGQFIDVTLTLNDIDPTVDLDFNSTCQNLFINGNDTPGSEDIIITLRATQTTNPHDTTYD
jgi:hypothetical protein